MSFARTAAAMAAASSSSSTISSASSSTASIIKTATSSSSSSSSSLVTRRLYRSLLRTSEPFASSPLLSSLLHRSGLDDDVPLSRLIPPPSSSSAAEGGEEEEEDKIKRELRSIHLTQKQARDLTRGYDELRRVQYERNKLLSEREVEVVSGSEFLRRELFGGESGSIPHVVLYRRLLREAIGGVGSSDDDDDEGGGDVVGVAQMRFPSHIADPGRLREVIRREFRAPPLSSSSSSDGEDTDDDVLVPISSRFDNVIRRDAAFLALRELNKKCTWIDKLTSSSDENNDDSKSDNDSQHKTTKGKKKNAVDIGIIDSKERNAMQAARNVYPLPLDPKSYLRPGTYLVAHPLLSGYFARTVIVLLDHTDNSDDDNDEVSSSRVSGGGGGGSGGTYGLVVNRPNINASSATTSSSSSSSLRGGASSSSSVRTLGQVVRPDSLPENLREAFGESPIREGGPVNVSLQMVHACSPEVEEKLGIGGNLLRVVEAGGDGGEQNGMQMMGEGGSLRGEEEDKQQEGQQQQVVVSTALETDHAVYFRGDIMRAARAVIDGDMDRDDFSFVVGASCWEVGQLESEIRRGYWFPCRGPPHMALSGMCDNVGGGGGSGGGGSSDDATASINTPSDDHQHVIRPKADLWLSMMCALGEKEADLAHLLWEDEYDENGNACDEF